MPRSPVASELYKDKIEIVLDNRQIFYLFFGGAVIVGLVFVLGVMVGRRVEVRGRLDVPHPHANVDPLAALDRLAGGAGLSFQGKLRNSKSSDGVAGPAAVENNKDSTAPEKSADSQKVEANAAEATKPDSEKTDDNKSEMAASEPQKSDDNKTESKSKFALQLSSFQAKSEAQAYLSQVKAAGFDAYLMEAKVDGKTYYRVRVGNFRSLDAAIGAKAEVDKAMNKSATVMKL